MNLTEMRMPVELTVTENKYFQVLTDRDGGYLEVVKKSEGQKLLEEMKAEPEKRAEAAIELAQTNLDMLIRTLKNRFQIDDPEAYLDQLSFSWTATLGHIAKTAADPEFRTVFDDYRRQADYLTEAQAELEVIRNGKTNPEANLARQIANERTYQIKRAALRAVRGNRNDSGSSSPTLGTTGHGK